MIAASETPIFGPYNMIMCRPGFIFSYSISGDLADGITVAFDLKIHSPATSIQNLFSVRNSNNNYVSLITYYDPTDGLVKVQLQNPNWKVVCHSETAITLGIDDYLMLTNENRSME